MKLNFSEILPWWERPWERLCNRLQQGTLPHAILISGQDGLGKYQFAREFSSVLLCQQPAENGARCKTCHACRFVETGNHPDLHLISPPEGKQNIRIDQIRDLTGDLGMKSHGGGRKVALIHPADRMNPAASNSLLKTLEEPTDNTVLILVSERPARLPATIRSRCQDCRMVPPPTSVARHWLEAQLGSKDAVPALLQLSAGAPIRALEMAGNEDLARRRDWFEGIRTIREAQADPVPIAAQWSDAKREMAPLHWFGLWLTDMIRCRQAPGMQATDLEFQASLQRLGASIPPQALHGLLQKVWEGIRLAETPLNRQLLVEDILIDWARA